MGIETFQFDLEPNVEHEFPFTTNSAFFVIKNRSIYPISLYLKDDVGYNATPVTIEQGKEFARPIVTDAVKCVSTHGGPVVVIAVPSAQYGGGVGPQGPQGDPGLDGANGNDGAPGTNGTNGIDGEDAFVYIAYASDSSGTGFTNTFSPALDYIAIKSTTTPLSPPVVGDFVGLWKNYKGATGAPGTSAQCAMFNAEFNANVGNKRVNSVGGTGSQRFNFMVPPNFGSLVSLKLRGNCSSIAGAGSGKNIDLYSDYSKTGELNNNHTETSLLATYSFTFGTDFEIDLAPVFSVLEAGDSCGVLVDQIATGTLAYYGIELRYNAV